MSLLLYGVAAADVEVADELVPVREGGLAAILAPGAGAAPDLPRLRAFDREVRALWRASPALLPARFGQSFRDEREARRWLAAEGPRLRERLDLVRRAAQMTIRIDGPAAPAAPDPSDAGPGTRFLLRRARELALPEAEPVRTAVGELVRAERVVRGGSAGRLGTVYHLVARDRVGEYGRRAWAAVPTVEAEGRSVAITGPWPPFAFAAGEA